MRKKDNFWLSSSVARGWRSFFFFGTIYKVSLEVGGGKGGTGDLGFFS